MLLKYGTEKDTTPSSTVAVRVVMKPGVAGLKTIIELGAVDRVERSPETGL